ncbi:MAG: hypothetical protein R6U89_09615 [Dehalococcoidia bacterium]
MSEINTETGIVRLEDFISMAGRGESVKLEVELHKENVIQKVHPDITDDSSMETEMYLLTAKYTHAGPGGETNSVKKVYLHGWAGESAVESQVNRHIANERLKMDYERLSNAGVTFEEKFF